MLVVEIWKSVLLTWICFKELTRWNNWLQRVQERYKQTSCNVRSKLYKNSDQSIVLQVYAKIALYIFLGITVKRQNANLYRKACLKRTPWRPINCIVYLNSTFGIQGSIVPTIFISFEVDFGCQKNYFGTIMN